MLKSFVERLLTVLAPSKGKGKSRPRRGVRATLTAEEADLRLKRQARAERAALAKRKEEARSIKRAEKAAKSAARNARRPFHVISFPKSGRTWLRVMLDELKLDAKYTHDGSGHSKSGHVDELAAASEPFAGERMLFLFRDPRDTVVSGYFQATKRIGGHGGYEGTISDFIRDPRHGVEKIVRFNMEWLARGPDLGDFYQITYEALKADTAGTLTNIIAFAGVERHPEEVAQAVSEGAFETMQARERSGELAERYGKILAPKRINDPNSFKVREGVIGGFHNHLAEDDVAFCNEVIARLGYPLERHRSESA